jgi:hypothetical protein
MQIRKVWIYGLGIFVRVGGVMTTTAPVGCVNSKKYIQVEIEYMKEEEYQVLKDN